MQNRNISLERDTCLVPLTNVSLSLPVDGSVQGGAAVPGKPAPAEGPPLQACTGSKLQVTQAMQHVQVATYSQGSAAWFSLQYLQEALAPQPAAPSPMPTRCSCRPHTSLPAPDGAGVYVSDSRAACSPSDDASCQRPHRRCDDSAHLVLVRRAEVHVPHAILQAEVPPASTPVAWTSAQ